MKNIIVLLSMFIQNDCTSGTIQSDVNSQYVKIYHIGLNRDKYYGPFIIYTNKSDSAVLSYQATYLFKTDDKEFVDVINFVNSYYDSLKQLKRVKGTCDNC